MIKITDIEIEDKDGYVYALREPNRLVFLYSKGLDKADDVWVESDPSWDDDHDSMLNAIYTEYYKALVNEIAIM